MIPIIILVLTLTPPNLYLVQVQDPTTPAIEVFHQHAHPNTETIEFHHSAAGKWRDKHWISVPEDRLQQYCPEVSACPDSLDYGFQTEVQHIVNREQEPIPWLRSFQFTLYESQPQPPDADLNAETSGSLSLPTTVTEEFPPVAPAEVAEIDPDVALIGRTVAALGELVEELDKHVQVRAELAELADMEEADSMSLGGQSAMSTTVDGTWEESQL